MSVAINDQGELLCCNPECGGNYLHQFKVEAFERREDAVSGLHVIVDNGNIKIDDNLSDNPSNRRHAVQIFFSCEFCHQESLIKFIQHKGNTYVETESIKRV